MKRCTTKKPSTVHLCALANLPFGIQMRRTDKSILPKGLVCDYMKAYLVGGSRHSAGLINEGEDSQGGVDWGPLQQVQTLLIVDELHIAPVNTLSSILFLRQQAQGWLHYMRAPRNNVLQDFPDLKAQESDQTVQYNTTWLTMSSDVADDHVMKGHGDMRHERGSLHVCCAAESLLHYTCQLLEGSADMCTCVLYVCRSGMNCRSRWQQSCLMCMCQAQS